MKNLLVWAVRHDPTGNYIPQLKTSVRGGSYVEPSADLPPRLFFSERSAKSFLGQWLRGRVEMVRRTPSSFDLYPDDDVVDMKHIPVPTRKKEEMSIVSLELNLP